jgi:DNA replication and repair protein RecF
LVAAGEALDDLRERGIARIDAGFQECSRDFPSLEGVGLVYFKGSPRGKTLREALDAERPFERQLGYTRAGPHRADFGLTRQGKAVVLSRGQQKAAVCVLQVACSMVQESALGVSGVWLVDDLWAELDWECAENVLAMLRQRDAQCLFTMVGHNGGQVQRLLPADTKLFHVEQGRVAAFS